MVRVDFPSPLGSGQPSETPVRPKRLTAKRPSADTVRFGAKIRTDNLLTDAEILGGLPPLPNAYHMGFQVADNYARLNKSFEIGLEDFLIGTISAAQGAPGALKYLHDIPEEQLDPYGKTFLNTLKALLPKNTNLTSLAPEEVLGALNLRLSSWAKERTGISPKQTKPKFEPGLAGCLGTIIHLLKELAMDLLGAFIPSIRNRRALANVLPTSVGPVGPKGALPFSKPLRQIMTTMIQKNPDVDNRGPESFFEQILEAAKDPTADKSVQSSAKRIRDMKSDLERLVKSSSKGGGKGNADKYTEEGFAERLTELAKEREDGTRAINDEQYEEIQRKIESLASLHKMDPQRGMVTEQLRTVLYEVPWQSTPLPPVSRSNIANVLEKVQQTLDKDHYGLKTVKRNITGFMATELHKQSLINDGVVDRVELAKKHKDEPTILCLIGPPGVGKTSMGHSIADALGRKFIRMSLGGVSSEAEIRGHRVTYMGSQSGRIIQGLIKAGTQNPVFMLDEIDKLGKNDFHGDPSAALLEVLDPEQNHTFRDNYLGIDYDLSKVMFICTANSEEDIPEPLRDRMHKIYLKGYDESEKMQIAKRHLIPKIRDSYMLNRNYFNNLPAEPFFPTDDKHEALLKEIIKLAPERGVRSLQHYLKEIGRGILQQVQDLHAGKLPEITPANLHEWVQVHSIEPKVIDPTPTVGLMRGMYFSNGPISGGSMDLNVLLVPKQATAAEPAGLYLGNITGNMKDVMRESVVQAFNFLQSHTKELGIPDEMLKQHIILNVNTPTLEMPKDGPSAGSALVLAMASALLGRPIRGDLAMTGTFGIQGNDFKGQVGQIGGVAEKITGSYNEGVRKFLVPQANIRDLNELSDWMKDAVKAGEVEIIPVTNIVQALNYTLGVGPKAKLELWQPSQSPIVK